MRLEFEQHRVASQAGESVLAALLRVGAQISFSCRSGVCHTCILRCAAGELPEAAQRSLPDSLRDKGYFLPCRCEPVSDMRILRPDPADLTVGCLLLEVDLDQNGLCRLTFDSVKRIHGGPGQRLKVQEAGQSVFEISLLSSSEDGFNHVGWAEGRAGGLPGWLREGEFGHDFVVTGPFEPAPVAAEVGAPAPDPDLWNRLGQGAQVRRVLEHFYPAVYADERLGPFFSRVTLDRIIDKQYSFLKSCMTGEKCYFGNRPRNAHHWMVISDELFDHRAALLRASMVQAGLEEPLIRRWERFEEHFRADIVKDRVWSRRVDGLEVETERVEEAVLAEATVCDFCGAEVESGTRVKFHHRLGTVACAACQGRLAP